MNEYMTRFNTYWAARSARERVLLTVGMGILLLVLLYTLLFDPLRQANRKMAASLPKDRAELRLIRTQVSEIESLLKQSTHAPLKGAALIHAVESAAAAQGETATLKSLTPQGDDQVRLVTESMPVAAWFAWFSELEQQGITVVACKISTDAGGGRIKVEASLAGEAR